MNMLAYYYKQVKLDHFYMKSTPQDFVERSNVRGFLAIFRDWAIIFSAAGISIWLDNVFVYVLSAIMIGCMQFSLGEALLHEATHQNLFKNKKWNTRFEFLFAYPVLVSIAQYEPEHLDHHNYQDTERDHIPRDYEYYGLNKPNKNLFWIWFAKPILGFSGYFYTRFVICLKPGKGALKILSLWIPVLGIFIYFDALPILLWYWVVPMFVIFPCFIYWSEIADHYNTKSGSRTRTGKVLNFLHHNNGYHHVHHTYPTIPWYNLPEANKILCPKDVDVSTSIVDTFRQLISSKSN